jgi:hypothetical protein
VKPKAAIGLGAVALSASMAFLSFSGASAQVIGQGPVINRFATPSVGVAVNQALQLNVVNDSAPAADLRRAALVVHARVLDKNGAVIAASDRQTIARGATFSWRLSKDVLAATSADELGRVQTRVEILVSGLPDSGVFIPSLELINTATGETESGMIGDIRTVISAEAAL